MDRKDWLHIHCKSDISREISHHKVDHVMAQRMSFNNSGNNSRNFFLDSYSLTWARRRRLCNERWVAGDHLRKGRCSSLHIFRSENCTDNCNPVKTLLGRLRLIDYALDVAQVDTADGDGSDFARCGGKEGQDLLRAGRTDDGLGVRFTVMC